MVLMTRSVSAGVDWEVEEYFLKRARMPFIVVGRGMEGSVGEPEVREKRKEVAVGDAIAVDPVGGPLLRGFVDLSCLMTSDLRSRDV